MTTETDKNNRIARARLEQAMSKMLNLINNTSVDSEMTLSALHGEWTQGLKKLSDNWNNTSVGIGEIRTLLGEAADLSEDLSDWIDRQRRKEMG